MSDKTYRLRIGAERSLTSCQIYWRPIEFHYENSGVIFVFETYQVPSLSSAPACQDINLHGIF